MRLVVLAVLLLLAVATIVSGVQTESGKLWYEDVKYLPVIL
jgi:hypothetical protein